MIIITDLHVNIVTGNAGKLREIRSYLDGVVSLDSVDVDLDEIQGQPSDIVRDKALKAFAKVGSPVLVEDTSLCFSALNGLPGPYIKWFLQSLGPEGLVAMLSGFEDKSASAQSVFGYKDALVDEPIIFVGETLGRIVKPRFRDEKNGFGWDCCFEPEGSHLTYAEMTLDQKQQASNRGKALKLVKHFFENL